MEKVLFLGIQMQIEPVVVEKAFLYKLLLLWPILRKN